MAKKEESVPPPPSKEQVLEERIDAMMDPRRTDVAQPAEEAVHVDTPGAELPPLDIFADTQSVPDLPSDLAKETDIKAEKIKEAVPKAVESKAHEEGETEPQPVAPLDLDDAANDAAVEDIVAHESDDLDDSLDETADEDRDQPAAKVHHHTVFWTFVTIIAVVALIAALLLASGGNLNFPGGKQLQNWFNSVSGK